MKMKRMISWKIMSFIIFMLFFNFLWNIHGIIDISENIASINDSIGTGEKYVTCYFYNVKFIEVSATIILLFEFISDL